MTLECNEGAFNIYIFWYLFLLPGLTLQHSTCWMAATMHMMSHCYHYWIAPQGQTTEGMPTTKKSTAPILHESQQHDSTEAPRVYLKTCFGSPSLLTFCIWWKILNFWITECHAGQDPRQCNVAVKDVVAHTAPQLQWHCGFHHLQDFEAFLVVRCSGWQGGDSCYVSCSAEKISCSPPHHQQLL